MPFFWPAKGCICTAVAPDLKSDMQTGWLVFGRIEGCSKFGEIVLTDN